MFWQKRESGRWRLHASRLAGRGLGGVLGHRNEDRRRNGQVEDAVRDAVTLQGETSCQDECRGGQQRAPDNVCWLPIRPPPTGSAQPHLELQQALVELGVRLKLVVLASLVVASP